MKIYAFEVRADEKKAFEQIADQCGAEVTLSSEVPSMENADLVKGYDGISTLGMGKLDRALLSRYRESAFICRCLIPLIISSMQKPLQR